MFVNFSLNGMMVNCNKEIMECMLIFNQCIPMSSIIKICRLAYLSGKNIIIWFNHLKVICRRLLGLLSVTLSLSSICITL